MNTRAPASTPVKSALTANWPLFDLAGSRAAVILIYYLLFSALYLLVERAVFQAPLSIPELAVDRAIPFIDWTIWIYSSQFIAIPAALYSLGRDNFRRTMRAMVAASFISFLIFFLMPTSVPRSAQALQGLTGAAYHALHVLDRPLNCFPSLHISLALLIIFGLRDERSKWFYPGVAWFIAIAVSVLTTKQHHAADMAGGIVLALICRKNVMKMIQIIDKIAQ